MRKTAFVLALLLAAGLPVMTWAQAAPQGGTQGGAQGEPKPRRMTPTAGGGTRETVGAPEAG